MALSSYLNENFKNFDSIEEVASHFLDKFGVYVKSDGDHHLFKYGMIEAIWSEDITAECRGAIFKYSDGWTQVSRPYDKFFNLSEGKCVLAKNFNDMISDCMIAEKADGTCIQYWFDEDNGQWRASTLGTVNPLDVYGYDITFKDLFHDTIGNKETLDSLLERGNTYIFELCTPMNQIVTEYENPIVYLLGARNISTGESFCNERHTELAYKMIEKSLNLKLPMFIKDDKLNTPEKLVEYVESQADTDMYGRNPEGFVVYHKNVPVAKIKNQRYCHLHRVVGGDAKHTINVILESFFTGTLDDIYGDLNDFCKSEADRIKDQFKVLWKDCMGVQLKCLEGKHFDTRKDFSLFVQENIDREFWAFCYQNMEVFENDFSKVPELSSAWICDNYKKFENIWKKA